MNINYYLDRVDSMILSEVNKGTITKREAEILRDKAYSFDNLSYGLNWLAKRIDEINEGN